MTDKNYNLEPGRQDRIGGVDSNPCTFMKLPTCMRQDTSKRLDVSICQACISGRIESHLFALREKMVPRDTARRN